ncbi:hypothetical protein BD779DRAFT_1472470 [Infundibulicybe gibba]|nr:hypothetical protein BD779DRAFT_1472470 [Infundibulicybe gibba]
MAETRRSGRDRKPSEKIAQLQQDEAEEAKTQAEAQKRREDRAKRNRREQDRSAGVPLAEDPSVERQDTMITFRPVVSKPKILAQRTSKVPPRHHIQSPHPILKVGAAHLKTIRHVGTPSRSPSPAPGTKRKQAFDDPLCELFAKAPKIARRGRPKASDYTEVEQDVIALANRLYRCLISTENAFPGTASELRMVGKAWEVALRLKGLDPIILAPGIFRVIRAHGPQVRGEAKSKMVLLVAAIYGFNSGQSKKVITANRNLAESLKQEKGFVFKTLGNENTPRKGVYQNHIIREGINALWFQNKQDEGIEFSELFDPIPVESIALILTAIECAIDEWATGFKTDIPFQAKEYMGIYNDHLDSLRAYGEHTSKHDLLGKMCQKLYDDGRVHAGVPPKTMKHIPAIPYSMFKAAVKEYEETPEEAEDDEDMV